MAALVGVLDGLDGAGASWVQVTGEPGIGKTRLVAELCEVAAARGAVVLAGRGAELERDVPFGIVIDALDDYLGSLGDVRLVELCGRGLGVLGRLFPALAGVGPPGALGVGDERYLTYRAVRGLVQRLAVPGPLVLVFDDLHWADAASVELVSFLLRRPPEARVLVVLAWRSGQAPGLGDALAVEARDLPGSALELGSLGEKEVGELIRGGLRGLGLRALYRESGGNPFYAQALASGASLSGPRERQGAGLVDGDAIPGLVATAVRHEIGSLSAPARLLAQGAAVAGEPFEPELAAACAGVSEGEAAAGLDELVAVGIVQRTQSPRRFVFRHPIVRRAVYDAAGPGWRRGAHARAVAVLSDRGAPLVSRAHHVAYSAASGDLAAARLLTSAAGEVLSRAPASALSWLEAASAIVPARPETVELRLSVRSAQAQVFGLLGELEGAHEALGQALELVAAGDPARVGLVAAAAGVEHTLGLFGEARARLLAALAEPSGAQGVVEASLCVELAVSWLYTLDFTEAAAWATRAAHAAHGSDELEATAWGLLAFVCASGENAAGNKAARAHRARAVAIVDGLSDEELAPRLDALCYLGWAERLLEEYHAAAVHLGRAIAIADRGGSSQWLLPTMVEQAKVLGCCGRLAEARELAATAVEMARLSRVDFRLLLALTGQVAVLGSDGEIEAASSAAAEALRLAAAIGVGYHAAIVRRQLALAHLESGDTERFLDELVGLEDGGEEIVRDGVACRLLEGRVRAALHGARTETAGGLAEQAHGLATGLGSPASAGLAARARARVLARTQPERALGLAADAIDCFEQSGAVLEAARTRVLAGEILAACDRREEALGELAAASERLDACGAHASAARARLVLRRVRRPRARMAREQRVLRGAAVLTRREREIAELVAGGLSNREIAARLTLSENTVETHLSHILAKLELRGRGAVARAINPTD